MVRNTVTRLAFLSVLAISGPAFAQASDAETTTASVTLAQPIALSETAALQFGLVAKGTTGSNTIVINETTGSRSLGGGGNASLVTGGTTGRAAYSVTGQDGATFSITLTSSSINLTDGGTGSLAATLTRSATTGTLTGGTATFGIGGTLTVDNTDANDAAGAYSGDFEVTVAYN
ncbi:MAG: DUF4402 domain-containing protein [Sphingobium sp.]|nr:DUF4402 domain-containing protein [Sphingobium sp.]